MNDRILDLIEKALQLAERLVVVEEKKELRLQSYADEKLAPKKKKAKGNDKPAAGDVFGSEFE